MVSDHESEDANAETGANADADAPADRSEPSDRIEPADRPPEWALRVINPVLSLLLRSPLHRLVSEHLLLLTVTGRETGTEYTFPVGYEREDDEVLVTSFGTNWWKNLRDGGRPSTARSTTGDESRESAGGQPVAVHLRGERRTGHATVVEDDRAVAEYVHGYLQRHGPDAANRVGLELPGDDVPDVAVLERAVDHVVLVRIDLEE